MEDSVCFSSSFLQYFCLFCFLGPHWSEQIQGTDKAPCCRREGVMASNGLIYCMPETARTVLRLGKKRFLDFHSALARAPQAKRKAVHYVWIFYPFLSFVFAYFMFPGANYDLTQILPAQHLKPRTTSVGHTNYQTRCFNLLGCRIDPSSDTALQLPVSSPAVLLPAHPCLAQTV